MKYEKRDDGARIWSGKRFRFVVRGEFVYFLLEVGDFYIGWDKP